MTAGHTTAPASSRRRRRPTAEFLQIWEEGYVSRRRSYEEMHLPSTLLLEGAPLRGDDGRLDRARVLAYVEAVISGNPRFRVRLQRSFLGLTPPAWVPDERFDLSRHIRFSDDVVDLATADLRRLGGADDGLMPTDHPLWRLRVTELVDGRVGLGMMSHHVTSDGLGAMKTMSDMCQKQPTLPLPAPRDPFDGERAASAVELPWLALRRWWKRQPTSREAWTSYWARPITKRVRRTVARVVLPLRYGYGADAARRATLPARHSSFRVMEASAAARYARELGGTLSDLLLAAMLAAWDGPESEIKARFPVSLRTAQQSHIRNNVRDMEIHAGTDLDLSSLISRIRGQVETRTERDAQRSAPGKPIGYATLLPWVSTPRFFAGAQVIGVTPTPASLATDELSALGLVYDGKIFLGATTPVRRDVEATVGRMYQLMTGRPDPGRGLIPEE